MRKFNDYRAESRKMKDAQLGRRLREVAFSVFLAGVLQTLQTDSSLHGKRAATYMHNRMATQSTPLEAHLRRTHSQEAAARQREIFLCFRILTGATLTTFCLAIPIYIYAAHAYSSSFCNVPLASWQWSFTIFLWVLLASFVVAFGGSRLLRDRNSPGNIAYLPALVSYIATGCWLIYGTVLVAAAGSDSCDGKLRGSSLGIVIAAWGGVMLLGLLQGLASLLQHRRAPKQATNPANIAAASIAATAAAGSVAQERNTNAMPYVVRNARAFGVGHAAAYAGTEASSHISQSSEPSPAIPQLQPTAHAPPAVAPPVSTWPSVLVGATSATAYPSVQASTQGPASYTADKVNNVSPHPAIHQPGMEPAGTGGRQSGQQIPPRALTVQQQTLPQVVVQPIPSLKPREKPAIIAMPHRPTLQTQHINQVVPPVPPRLAVGTGPSIDVRPDVELVNISQPAPVPPPTQLASAARTQRSATIQRTDTAAAAVRKFV